VQPTHKILDEALDFFTFFISNLLTIDMLGTSKMDVVEMQLPALKLLASRCPLVIGHRGYCHLAPENTLPSFDLALSAGADLVELDCRPSKDGALMVIHDRELDRTTDVRRSWKKRHVAVELRTAAEIQSLDAGRWFNRKFAGTKVPLLSEALETIQAGSVTLIERKAGSTTDVIGLLREKNLINHVVVQSFDWEFLRLFHELEPSQALGALGPPTRLAHGEKPPRISKKLSLWWLAELAKTGAQVAVWNRRVSKGAIEKAQQWGLKVWVYTINDSRLAGRLLALGVHGIITNKIALVQRVRDSI
jgi:glycerophosphoryl diester phosphodiesterase